MLPHGFINTCIPIPPQLKLEGLNLQLKPALQVLLASLSQQLFCCSTHIINMSPAATETAIESTDAPKRAFVTFLAGNGDYWKGVVGLAKGLRKVKTVYPLIVAVLPDVPEDHRQILEYQGCIVREIEPVYPPANQTQFAMAYYVINYSKLRIWEVRSIRLLVRSFVRSNLNMYSKVFDCSSWSMRS